jgi:hypothetical protein
MKRAEVEAAAGVDETGARISIAQGCDERIADAL